MAWLHWSDRIARLGWACALVLLVAATGSWAARPAPTGAAGAAAPRGVATDDWAVQLAPGSDASALAARLGFQNLGQIGPLKGYFLLRQSGSAKTAASAAAALARAPEVAWFAQQLARQQFARDPGDPLFGAQWHLRNTGQSGGTPGQDANVPAAWNAGYNGAGVRIAVVDDGLQYTHADIAPNYRAASSYDFNGGDADPAPAAGNRHGTSVAGVAAAAADAAVCGVGAAYAADLAGIRLTAAAATDAQEALALSYQYAANAIYNNSWGPADDGATLEAPGPLTRAALADAAANGRSGRGSIFVWAAGNGRQYSDDINADGYANSRYVVAVGAVDHRGVASYYSERGAAMLVTAPSSGGGAAITTSDLDGSAGYSEGNCTSNFSGTSAASPLVAGVVALMLEANPSLHWRDVQTILLQTAQQNDPTNSDWQTNGAGYPINHNYGFGRVDAQAAVAAALGWTNLPAEASVAPARVVVGAAIPDNSAAGVSRTLDVNAALQYVEHVELRLDATHPRRGDLEVILIAPSGTQSRLIERRPTDPGANFSDWSFTSVRHWGENPNGSWQVQIADRATGNSGTFDAFQLILYGPPGTPADTPTASSTSTPTGTLTPGALPDLLVQSLQIELESGGSCNFASTALGVAATIANNGTADAGAFVVEVNGVQQSVASLAAGQTLRLWFAGFVAFGINSSTADASALIAESNESNNTRAELLPIPTLPPTCTPTHTPTGTPTAPAGTVRLPLVAN